MTRQRPAAAAAVSVLLFAFTLALYTRTMAPGTLMDLGDPGDLQAAAAALGVPHPTGYPLFVLIGWAWVHLLPIGTMAYRLTLLVAIFGALAVSLTYLLARRLVGRTLPAVAAALLFGLGYTYWTQTSISEVYTLNAVFVAAVLLLLVRWSDEVRAGSNAATLPGRRTLILAALVYGLSLAHHRTMILLLPAIAVYVWLVDRRVYRDARLLARLVLAALPGPLLYIYVFWRLLPQGQSAGDILWGTILGGSFIGSLGQAPDWVNILWTQPAAQMGAAGLAAAVAGLAILLSRIASRAAAVLLFLCWLAVSAFCLIYRIPEIEPFLIPAYLCLSVAAGAVALPLGRLPRAPRLSAETLLAAAPLLLLGNIAAVPAYWSAEQNVSEARARSLLAGGLEPGAAIEADWNTAAALRYLVAAEGLRPDLEVLPVRLSGQAEYQRLGTILQQGRPVYLLQGVDLSRVGGAAARWDWPQGTGGPTRLAAATFTAHQHDLSPSVTLRGFLTQPSAVTLLWQARSAVPADYATVVDYYDAAGRLLAQDDKDPQQEPLWGFRTLRWQPGEMLSDLYRSLPDGAAYLRAYLSDAAGRKGATVGRAATVQIRPAVIPSGATATGAVFGGQIALAAYSVVGSSPITLTLYWQPAAPPSRDLTIFVHALDAGGQLAGQADRPPVDGLYPTSDWRPGDLIIDTYVVKVERPAIAIRLGLYDRSTMQRLPLAAGGDSVLLDLPAQGDRP